MTTNFRQKQQPIVDRWKAERDAQHRAIKDDLQFLRDKAEWNRLTLEIRQLEKKLAPWWVVMKYNIQRKRMIKSAKKAQQKANNETV